MFDYNNPNIREQIATIFIAIAKKIQEDDEFAKSIFGCLDESSNDIKNAKKKKKSLQIISKTYGMNIFEMYQKDGPHGLLEFLEPLDLKDLKSIVVENGLDPAQKVRRWRLKEKIIKHIVETIGKQMSKGEVFFKQ
ncbi:MAG: hypothetical protein ABGX20_21290 [Bacillus sp. (in: firmicutes)]